MTTPLNINTTDVWLFLVNITHVSNLFIYSLPHSVATLIATQCLVINIITRSYRFQLNVLHSHLKFTLSHMNTHPISGDLGHLISDKHPIFDDPN